jgi:hypothetical protein
MSRLTAKNNNANFNKLNERGYVVDLNNTKNVGKYEDALGLTSLQQALSILVNKDSTDDEKAGAISDLIMIRLILSGKIQFRSSKFGGLITKTVGKGFEGVQFRNLDEIDIKLNELVNNLDKKPGEELKIFKGFLTTLITTFITTAGLSIAFHAIGTISMVDNNLDSIRNNLSRTRANIDKMTRAPIQTTISPNGTPISYYLTQTQEYHQLQKRFAEEGSIFNSMLGPEYFGKVLGKQLLNQGTIFAPLIIGLLASMIAANVMIKSQNKTIRTALVKMIDRYMIIDEEIFRILNEKGAVPKVFENDGPAMALYNRYIRSMRKEYDIIKKAANQKQIQNQRVEIEAKTGTNVLNMGKFLTPGLEDNCSICAKPLATAGMTVVEIKPCNHKFHETCIKTWQETGIDKKCPLCNGVIESLVPVTFITSPLPNRNLTNANSTGTPNNNASNRTLPGATGGTRKKRSNRRRKSKTRSVH